MQKENGFLERILLVLSLIFISLRFVSPGIVPFIIDEPIFQAQAENILKTGKWPLVYLGGSSIPISYGGGAMWLYTIPHFFSENPLAFTIFHTTIYSFCFLFLYLTLRKFFSSYISAWVLLAATTSPFLFFFSRHTWDTTFFVPFIAIMIFSYSKLVLESTKTPWRLNFRGVWPLLLIAFLSALSINIHLMIGPFILALFLSLLFWLWWQERKNIKAWAAVFCCGLLMVILCIPYALAALEFMKNNADIMAHNDHQRWGNARHLWWNILFTFYDFSVWRTDLFYAPMERDFASFCGQIFSKIFYLDLFAWIIKVALIGMFLFSLWRLLKSKFKKISYFESITIAGFLAALLVFQYLNIPMQPHYFQSVWWVPFALLAITIEAIRGSWRNFFYVLLSGAILTNAVFLIFTFSYITQNGGIRSMRHSTGILETQKSVRDFCLHLKQKPDDFEQNEFSLDISSIYVGANAIDYFLKRLPECQGEKILLVRSDASDYKMIYWEESGGNARFHWVKAGAAH